MKDNKELEKCTRCLVKVSWVSVLDSVFLALFKGAVGLATGSRALTASALYSVHDVVSSVAVLVGLKISKDPPDKNHPYGHGNIEYIVAAFMSIMILVATIFLVADVVRIIFSGRHANPHWAALGAALISVVANEILYRFNMCAHKHVNSPVVYAHGKHHRADAISSVAVAIAIAGSMMGFRSLDALVALFETGHLIVVSAEILYHGGSGLIDRAVKEEDRALIKAVVGGMPEIEEVKNIKTRQIGRSVWVDLYISLSVDTTIAEVNTISDSIRAEIGSKVKHIGNVNVICV